MIQFRSRDCRGGGAGVLTPTPTHFVNILIFFMKISIPDNGMLIKTMFAKFQLHYQPFNTFIPTFKKYILPTFLKRNIYVRWRELVV